MRKFLIISILALSVFCSHAQKKFHVDFYAEDCPKKRALSFFFDDGEKLIPAQVTTKGNQYSIEGTYFSKFTVLEIREKKVGGTFSLANKFLLEGTSAKIQYNSCDTTKSNYGWKDIKSENTKNFIPFWDSIYLYAAKENNEANEKKAKLIELLNLKTYTKSSLFLNTKLASDSAINRLYVKQLEYIKSNSADYMSFLYFRDIIQQKLVFDSDYIAEVFNAFPEDIKNGFEGIKVAQLIKEQRKRYANPPKIGEQAPDFQAIDVLGKDVKLADFKDKHTLLVFWSTGCGPCIQEIATIKKFRAKYDPKELSIVYVSENKDKNRMLNFIKKRDMNWTHIFGNQLIAKDYFVDAIPVTVLIDPDSKITYINVGSDIEALSEKLAEGIKNYKNVAR